MPQRRDEPVWTSGQTQVMYSTAGRPGGRKDRRENSRKARSNLRWLIPAGLLAVLALVYAVDLAMSEGEVPRGVVVSGVELGGLSTAAAEQTLRAVVQPRLAEDVPVQAGSLRTSISPEVAGLSVDWVATVAEAGEQPLNPWTRFTSLFAEREFDVVTTANEEDLSEILGGLSNLIKQAPVNGGIEFVGTTPMAVEPESGVALDLPGSVAAVKSGWTSGETVELPLLEVVPSGKVSPEEIERNLEEVARPAVAAPLMIRGEGVDATISPSVIAGALTFEPDGAGGLNPVVQNIKIEEAATPQLASTEQPAQEASLTMVGGRAVVRPSVDGREIDYDATLSGVLDVLKRTDNREITAIYIDQPAELTTERVDQLGIAELVSEFSTGGFATDSGKNIRRAAEQINGAIVEPGETFSLNEATRPRDAAHGYVLAGIIEDGHPDRGIGGGVSQLATTLYNAAYFAGMTDVEHKEHSYYISRYPVAREATVFAGLIDLKFRNDSDNAVLIETVWTPEQITVKFWGTKRYEVTSTTGPRTNPTEPQTVTIPAGEPCSPSDGSPGFTATDTRTVRDLKTGETTSNTRTVKYNPAPKVVCEGGPTPARPPR